MKKRFIGAMGGLMLGVLALGISNAQANTIELALVLDGSGSISSTNWTLQTNAYKDVFNNSFFTNYVPAGDNLYVSAYQFGSTVVQEIGWTHIDSDLAAASFGNLFGSITQLNGLTATGDAIDLAASGITGNSTASDRQVIDVSTDGQPNVGTPNGLQAAIDAATNAYASGITVNLLGVGSINTANMTSIASAGGGFYLNAPDFNAFEGTLKTKLYREINPVPEPASMLLIGIGLAGLTGFRTLRKK